MLTELDDSKNDIAEIRQLLGEAKNLAKAVRIRANMWPDGLKILLKTLEKSYRLTKESKLDFQLMDRLAWSSNNLSMERSFGDFSQVARISDTMEIPPKLQGILLLRQVSLTADERGRVIARTRGSLEIQDITTALKVTDIGGRQEDVTPSNDIAFPCNSTFNGPSSLRRVLLKRSQKLCKFYRRTGYLEKHCFRKAKAQ